LGAEPLQRLYEAVVAPIAQSETKGACTGRGVSSVSKEAAEAFGRPGASRGATAFPQIRFVAWLENGTPVLRATRMDRYSVDEWKLAEAVIPALSPRGEQTHARLGRPLIST
jgi:hypothetical protein